MDQHLTHHLVELTQRGRNEICSVGAEVLLDGFQHFHHDVDELVLGTLRGRIDVLLDVFLEDDMVQFETLYDILVNAFQVRGQEVVVGFEALVLRTEIRLVMDRVLLAHVTMLSIPIRQG
jgi:hypothetical protein